MKLRQALAAIFESSDPTQWTTLTEVLKETHLRASLPRDPTPSDVEAALDEIDADAKAIAAVSAAIGGVACLLVPVAAHGRDGGGAIQSALFNLTPLSSVDIKLGPCADICSIGPDATLPGLAFHFGDDFTEVHIYHA